MGDRPDVPSETDRPEAAKRFGRLPDRVPPEQMLASQPSHPPADPTMGRDSEFEHMLRYSAG